MRAGRRGGPDREGLVECERVEARQPAQGDVRVPGLRSGVQGLGHSPAHGLAPPILPRGSRGATLRHVRRDDAVRLRREQRLGAAELLPRVAGEGHGQVEEASDVVPHRGPGELLARRGVEVYRHVAVHERAAAVPRVPDEAHGVVLLEVRRHVGPLAHGAPDEDHARRARRRAQGLGRGARPPLEVREARLGEAQARRRSRRRGGGVRRRRRGPPPGRRRRVRRREPGARGRGARARGARARGARGAGAHGRRRRDVGVAHDGARDGARGVTGGVDSGRRSGGRAADGGGPRGAARRRVRPHHLHQQAPGPETPRLERATLRRRRVHSSCGTRS